MSESEEGRNCIEENEKQSSPSPYPRKPRPKFSVLRNLKREMEFRGSLLGKTWSELSDIMSKYQAELIETHDVVETSGTPIEHEKLTNLEKRISELEHKLLSKDSEIVTLRTEVHQLRNEVAMKDNLIQKMQNQMAREALEFQTEISALKELLDRQNGGVDDVMSSELHPSKRRKVSMLKTVQSTNNTATTSLKSEPAQSSCKLVPSNPVFPSPQLVKDKEEIVEPLENVQFKLEPADDIPDEVYEGLEQELDTGQDDSLLASGAIDSGVLGGAMDNPQSSQARPGADPLPPPVTGPSAPPGTARLAPPATSYGVITNTVGGVVPKANESDMVICQLCSTGMPKNSLVSHQRSQHGIKPYTCGFCALSFNIKSDCVQHVRRAHSKFSKRKKQIKLVRASD